MKYSTNKIGFEMKKTISSLILKKLSNVLTKRPSNAFLLLLTGFFFAQFMLFNILHTKNPLGGWVTSVGTFTTSSLLFVSLLALSVCLFALWRSVATQEKSTKPQINKTVITKPATKRAAARRPNIYSPIDYPRGSSQAVVSGYVLG